MMTEEEIIKIVDELCGDIEPSIYTSDNIERINNLEKYSNIAYHMIDKIGDIYNSCSRFKVGIGVDNLGQLAKDEMVYTRELINSYIGEEINEE